LTTKTLNIFIVEDEKIIRVPLADELRDAGYKVQEYWNTHQAFMAIRQLPVDVVITDIKMPFMNGLELLTKIKSIKPDTPVIVITSYGSEDTATEAMKRGAYDYVEKPFDLDEMLVLLDRIKEQIYIKHDHV
jgi:DNA-binding NtrC family response regulator